MTEVHFFSKRPAYFLSNSSFCGEGEGWGRQEKKKKKRISGKHAKKANQSRGLSIIGEGLWEGGQLGWHAEVFGYSKKEQGIIYTPLTGQQ